MEQVHSQPKLELATYDSLVTLFTVEGKTALVTGASSGIGKVIAARLSLEGCNVILAARRQSKLEELADLIKNLHGKPVSSSTPEGKANTLTKGETRIVLLDVSENEKQIDSAVGSAWNAFGGIDILVNNAGCSEGSLSDAETTFEKGQECWDKVIQTNLRGAALVANSVAKRMIQGGMKGSIINISSIVGTSRFVFPGMGIYASSKAALIALTKHLAVELGVHGIRVNAIAPGVYPSEMTENSLSRLRNEAEKFIPLGRWGEVDPDLTAVVLLLASKVGCYINGATIIIDGGLSLRPLLPSE